MRLRFWKREAKPQVVVVFHGNVLADHLVRQIHLELMRRRVPVSPKYW